MKRLIVLNPASDEKDVIATFRLKGDVVEIEENVKGAIAMMALDQVVPTLAEQEAEPDLDDDAHEDDRKLTLDASDGRRYWAALDYAFANSTHCYIETVPDDDA